MVLNCSVPFCKTIFKKERGIKFHSFPENKKLRKQWIVKLRFGKAPSDYARVCSKHFLQSDYRLNIIGDKYFLKNGSVPSMNLPVRSHDKPPKYRKPSSYFQKRNSSSNQMDFESVYLPDDVNNEYIEETCSQNGIVSKAKKTMPNTTVKNQINNTLCLPDINQSQFLKSWRECKEKWIVLRKSYSALLSARKTFSNKDDLKKLPKGQFEDQLSFLAPFIDHAYSKPPETSFNYGREEINFNANAPTPVTRTSTPSNIEIPNSRPINEATDETEMFFLCLARNVKSFPDKEQVKLKMDITNLIFQSELKNFSPGEKSTAPPYTFADLSFSSTLSAYSE